MLPTADELISNALTMLHRGVGACPRPMWEVAAERFRLDEPQARELCRRHQYNANQRLHWMSPPRRIP